MEERTYRVILRKNGREYNEMYYTTNLETIARALKNNVKGHPEVVVYSHYGKNPLCVFQG